MGRGSSPLARGLLVQIDGVMSPIPDHPRSRGVYMDEEIYVIGDGGSSPLARGLPDGVDSRAHGARIIPARAGFTIASDDAPESVTDHPRSRGVYARARQRESGPVGSSPLARGLLWRTTFTPP